MKDKDFQQLVDHEFAQLEWTDQQRMHTLRQMNKEERPVMKRKLSVALVVTLLLLTLTGTAVAAGLNIPTLQEFFDRYHSLGVTWDIIPALVNESAVVKPVAQRHTSNLVDVTVDQMYLTDKAFYFTVQYMPKKPDTLLFSIDESSIMLDGEKKHYWHLWDQDNELLQVGSISIDDLSGLKDPIQTSYNDCVRDPETGAITQVYAFKDAEDIAFLRVHGGHTLMLRFQVYNLRNHALEWNVLFVDFPQMEAVETHGDAHN